MRHICHSQRGIDLSTFVGRQFFGYRGNLAKALQQFLPFAAAEQGCFDATGDHHGMIAQLGRRRFDQLHGTIGCLRGVGIL